jgi:hypothetical protein
VRRAAAGRQLPSVTRAPHRRRQIVPLRAPACLTAPAFPVPLCQQVELDDLALRHGVAKRGTKAEVVDRLLGDLLDQVRAAIWGAPLRCPLLTAPAAQTMSEIARLIEPRRNL